MVTPLTIAGDDGVANDQVGPVERIALVANDADVSIERLYLYDVGVVNDPCACVPADGDVRHVHAAGVPVDRSTRVRDVSDDGAVRDGENARVIANSAPLGFDRTGGRIVADHEVLQFVFFIQGRIGNR